MARTRLIAAIVGLLVPCASASAAPIISNPGDTCTAFVGAPAGSCSTGAVQITPHALWQPNNPDGSGAVWISYAATGISPDNVLAPRNGDPLNPIGQTVLLTVTEIINPIASAFVSLKMWADDTAKFYVDGLLVKTTDFIQGGACNATPIGCTPNNFFLYNAQLSAGPHTFTWEVFQVGTGTTNDANPFGLLYAGEFSVPEPTTLTIFGIGLLGMGLASRRRRKIV
jgi:hypothetical protein